MMDQKLVCALLLGLTLALALASSICESAQTAASLAKLIKPEKTGKEIRMDLKLFLTKMKLRRVPLAKERSEKLLTKLYREERIIKEQLADLERNLNSISDKSRHQNLRVIEVQKSADADKEAGNQGVRRNLMKVSELTQGRIESWQGELAEKRREFAEIRAKIDEAKNIIKNPESYISIPSNYGRVEPEEVQEREREVLVKDRMNMNYRASVESGAEDPPYWLIDHW